MAVIGGGINGLFTALDLTLRGFSVVLLERGPLAVGRVAGCMARYIVVLGTLQ